jgi:histidinol-phosphate aminotransferase
MIEPRIDLVACAPAVHGGTRAEGVLDFSANVNAWGMPPAVRAAINSATHISYPDPLCLAPRHALAQLWNLDLSTIGFLPGASEALHRVARAYLRADDAGVVALPGFGEYSRAIHATGAQVVYVRGNGFTPSTDQLLEQAERRGARLIMVASPSSPFGKCYEPTDLRQLANRFSGLVVLDESFRTFAELCFAPPTLMGHERVVHIRSITKDFALAGVRAAFVVAEARVVQAIECAGPPWAASSLAQTAACAALSSEGLQWLENSLTRMRDARAQLCADLEQLDVAFESSQTNYLCLRLPGQLLAAQLLDRRIAVRDCTSFGFPEYTRIAVRTPDENAQLIAALTDVVCSVSC